MILSSIICLYSINSFAALHQEDVDKQFLFNVSQGSSLYSVRFSNIKTVEDVAEELDMIGYLLMRDEKTLVRFVVGLHRTSKDPNFMGSGYLSLNFNYADEPTITCKYRVDASLKKRSEGGYKVTVWHPEFIPVQLSGRDCPLLDKSYLNKGATPAIVKY